MRKIVATVKNGQKQSHIIKTVRPSRNLANIANIRNSGYYTSSISTRNAIRSLEVGKQYVMSADYRLRYSSSAIRLRYQTSAGWNDSPLIGNRYGDRVYWHFTLTEDIKGATSWIYYFGGGGTEFSDYGYVENVQIEEGDKATPYEPYGLIEETHLVGDLTNG